VLLVGVTGLIVKLMLTGQMVKYMSPALDPLTLAAASVVLVMALAELSQVWRRPAAEHHHEATAEPDEHGHTHGGRAEQALTVLLLGGSLALGLLLTPRALTTAALGGEDLAAYLLAFGPPPASRPVSMAASQPIEDVPELLSFVQRVGEGSLGQRVRVTGLVAPGGGLLPGEFAIMRYAIVHCVADARPLGLLISYNGATPPSSQWIEIEGVIALRERQGNRWLTIEATATRPVAEPANPYVPPLF
jgi:uncharacterized repeat protein (TIGR03943 family)